MNLRYVKRTVNIKVYDDEHFTTRDVYLKKEIIMLQRQDEGGEWRDVPIIEENTDASK